MSESTPLRTESEKDVNFLSFNRDSIVWFAGSVEETQNSDDLPDPLILLPVEPKVYDSILKFSGCTGAIFTRACVAQGKENAIDINARSANVVYHGDIGITGDSGEQVITIKGGSQNCEIHGEIWSRGTRCDVAVGLWSDQSTEVSQYLDLSGLVPSVTRKAGNEQITFILCRVNQPWRAWFGSAPKDIQLPAGAKVLKLKSLGAQLHWWTKFVGVKCGFIKGRK